MQSLDFRRYIFVKAIDIGCLTCYVVNESLGLLDTTVIALLKLVRHWSNSLTISEWSHDLAASRCQREI